MSDPLRSRTKTTSPLAGECWGGELHLVPTLRRGNAVRAAPAAHDAGASRWPRLPRWSVGAKSGHFISGNRLSPTQFFLKGVAHHVGESLISRKLLQGFVHQCLVVTAGHFGAGFEKGQGGVVHPDGNPRFTAAFSLELGQRGNGGYRFGVGEID
jgi:hypothetical protein